MLSLVSFTEVENQMKCTVTLNNLKQSSSFSQTFLQHIVTYLSSNLCLWSHSDVFYHNYCNPLVHFTWFPPFYSILRHQKWAAVDLVRVQPSRQYTERQRGRRRAEEVNVTWKRKTARCRWARSINDQEPEDGEAEEVVVVGACDNEWDEDGS